MRHHSPHRWPAEWEPQIATWIAWPHNRQTWPDRFESVPAVFQEFILEIARVQPVHVLSGPPQSDRPPSSPSPPQAAAKSADSSSTPNSSHRDASVSLGWDRELQQLSEHERIQVHQVTTNDSWIRDYGPTFVEHVDDRQLIGIDWHYNAWGEKYPPYQDDALVAEWICRYLGCPRSISPLYCEGGALETDGHGTLLTTSSCVLNPNRNPGWSREMVANELSTQLGVSNIIWVDGGGLEGDDTDGHIDQLARFVAPGVVVVAVNHQPDDPNAPGLQMNLELLQKWRSDSNERLEVHPLPTPPPRYIDRTRVPESYCNFVFTNETLIVPTFRSSETDALAIETLSRLVPDRRVVALDAYHLAWGLGAFHCASQQQPASIPGAAPRSGSRADFRLSNHSRNP